MPWMLMTTLLSSFLQEYWVLLITIGSSEQHATFAFSAVVKNAKVAFRKCRIFHPRSVLTSINVCIWCYFTWDESITFCNYSFSLCNSFLFWCYLFAFAYGFTSIFKALKKTRGFKPDICFNIFSFLKSIFHSVMTQVYMQNLQNGIFV